MLGSGVRPRAGQVILNGADDAVFRVLLPHEIDKFRSEVNLNGTLVLLTVGKVTERKGQDVVIRALPAILKEIPNTQYLIIGMPSRKEKFLKLAKELGVSKNVRFYGKVETSRVVQFLNCSDLFVLTSRCPPNGHFEGFGIAAVEAALCGKPAVVTNNSGLVEAISEGETGFAVPEENVPATADTILALLKDETLRRHMGEAARTRALREQTWHERVKDYDFYLRGVVEKS